VNICNIANKIQKKQGYGRVIVIYLVLVGCACMYLCEVEQLIAADFFRMTTPTLFSPSGAFSLFGIRKHVKYGTNGVLMVSFFS
jgi:hypothetical protein